FDVVFTENVTSGTNILVRRFTATGSPQATNPTVTVASGATGTVSHAKIAVGKDGAFVVAYVAPSVGNFNSIFARSFNADGTANGPTIQVATTDFGTAHQTEPDVAVVDGTGAFEVTWTDQVTPTNGDIHARGFTAGGAPTTADVALTSTAANDHQPPIHLPPAASSGPNPVGVSRTRDGDGATP